MARRAALAPTRRIVEMEVLDEHEAAQLIGLPLHIIREQSCIGALPAGVWREGRAYFVSSEQATRLRQLRASPDRVRVVDCDGTPDHRRATLASSRGRARATAPRRRVPFDCGGVADRVARGRADAESTTKDPTSNRSRALVARTRSRMCDRMTGQSCGPPRFQS